MSRGAYYLRHKSLKVSETELEERIINCFDKHRGNYGRIRLKKALKRDGVEVSENKISRILRKYGRKAKSGRKGRAKRRVKRAEEYMEENLIKEKFKVKEPNYLWCSDITELRYRRGKFYVCGIIDVATRRIVGWSVSKRQTQQIVQEAFQMAVGKNPNRPKGAIYHSDRGCQYTALDTKKLVEKAGFRKSMSRPGKPTDNQPIESFWHTLEIELDDVKALDFQDAKRAVVKYIEMYYNSERLHSGINYTIPNQFLTLRSVYNS